MQVSSDLLAMRAYLGGVERGLKDQGISAPTWVEPLYQFIDHSRTEIETVRRKFTNG